MNIKAVISDMDGVIVNSEAYHFLSFQKMLKLDYGIDYTHEDDTEFLGTTDVYVWQILRQRYPHIKIPVDQWVQRRTELYKEIFKEHAKALPCVYPLFAYISQQKLPLGLGTSASKGVVELTLKTLHLEKYFDAIVCANDVQHGKPAPDIFLEVSRRLDVTAEKCLVLEDSQYGVQAAKAAGMKCIAIPCGPTLKQDLSLADHVVKSLCEITPELLSSLK